METRQQEKPTMTGMTNTLHTPARAEARGRRVLRGLARVLGVTIALIVALALAGVSFEALFASGDATRYPPPGRLVDVGGYRLHIQCVGTGSPTVVLDAGLGGTSLDWNLVQTELGLTTRTCAYDRAGMGWSDAGPQPRTPNQIASELHTLLTNAGIAGPYVLVGQSLGGKNVRLFALQHPDQVVGMVLVDARSEYVDIHTSSTDAQAFQKAIASQALLYGVARQLGLVRLIGASQSGAPAMSSETRMAMSLFATGQPGRDTTTAEALERATDDAELQAAPSLGERSLIVLAAGQMMEMDPFWPEAQRQQAALSTNGRLITVPNSGHSIHWEQPAVVIDAVRQVVAEARST
jgi:pimeloyl-ACP methyl ester carboxylesterase